MGTQRLYIMTATQGKAPAMTARPWSVILAAILTGLVWSAGLAAGAPPTHGMKAAYGPEYRSSAHLDLLFLGGKPNCGANFGPMAFRSEEYKNHLKARPIKRSLIYTGYVSISPVVTMMGSTDCVEDWMTYRQMQQEAYVAENHDQIMRDAARGQGDHLATLASLLGCSSRVRGTFGQVAQAWLSAQKPGQEVSHGLLLDGMREETATHAILMGGCQNGMG